MWCELCLHRKVVKKGQAICSICCRFVDVFIHTSSPWPSPPWDTTDVLLVMDEIGVSQGRAFRILRGSILDTYR